MKKVYFIVLFLIVTASDVMLAWGNQGHKLIAEIAKSKLDKEVADLVNYYLDGNAWDKAACWMDEVKEEPGQDYMRSWHYVYLEKDKTYVKTRERDVVNQLEFAITTLKRRSNYQKEDINKALKVLFHLIGDIHQPLNCGYPADKGGHDTKVNFLGKSSDLHKVWDKEIIETSKIKIWDCLKTIMEVSEEKTNVINATDITNWMNESRSLLNQVYSYTGNDIDEAYVTKSSDLIKIQLTKAGVRLATILNSLFRE